MKKILIATTNKDKFEIVKKLFIQAGINEKNYQILSLNSINYNGPDRKEVGYINERAMEKVKTVIKYIENRENYDYVVGVDDGIKLKGKMIENVKEYIKKILYESYLIDGEEFSFPRAYCIIGKDGKLYQKIIEIPYIYKSKDDIEIQPFSYPLSQIAMPIGYNKTIAEMTKEEANEYYWKYSEDNIKELIKDIIK